MMGVTQLSAPAFFKCKLSPRGWKFGVRGCSAFEYVCLGTCAHIAQCPSVFPHAVFIPPFMRVHTHKKLCPQSEGRLMGQRSKPGTAAIGKEGKSNTWKKAKEGDWPPWRWLSGIGRVEGPKDKILGFMEVHGAHKHCEKRMAHWTPLNRRNACWYFTGGRHSSKRLSGKTFCQAKPGDHFLLAWLWPGRNFLLWHCKTKGAKSYGVKGDVQTKSILWG